MGFRRVSKLCFDAEIEEAQRSVVEQGGVWHVVVNKNETLRQIPHWDALDNVRTLSLEEMGLRVEAKESFQKWSLFEELSWRQKSREVWLKEGDRNTRFFHKRANAHKRNNQLGRICINVDWFIEG